MSDKTLNEKFSNANEIKNLGKEKIEKKTNEKYISSKTTDNAEDNTVIKSMKLKKKIGTKKESSHKKSKIPEDTKGINTKSKELKKKKAETKKELSHPKISDKIPEDEKNSSTKGSTRESNSNSTFTEKSQDISYKGQERINDGIVPLTLSTNTQKLFNCIPGETIDESIPSVSIVKQAILNDIKERGIASDFYSLKQMIIDYPGDELLLIHDSGKNFNLCITPEARESKEITEMGINMEQDEEHEEIMFAENWPSIEYNPYLLELKSKSRTSLGSEKEIEEQQIKDKREKIFIKIMKDTKQPLRKVSLQSQNAHKTYQEFPSIPSREQYIYRKTFSRGIQNVTPVNNVECQTEYKDLKQIAIQYEPRMYETDKKVKVIGEEERIINFVETASESVIKVIKENISSDIFKEDWLSLSKEEYKPPVKFADGHIKILQSFTSLKYSINKMITHISWHPEIEGIITVSCIEPCSYYERIDKFYKLSLEPSLILVWSFIDCINPKLLLEAPDDVKIFQFNPTNPNLIAGGCINGQLVLWDLTSYSEELQKMTELQKQSKGQMFIIYGDEKMEVPVVKYVASSHVEHGHKSEILHLEWLPNNIEVGENGFVQYKDLNFSVQIMTTGADSKIMMWDIRSEKKFVVGEKIKTESNYSCLDLVWKPFHSFELMPTEDGKKSSVSVFTFDIKEILDNSKANKPQTESYVPTSNYFGGTLGGDIFYGDWHIPCGETGQLMESIPPVYFKSVMNGYINTIQSSPFIKDIYLVIGGWNMAIWKSGVEYGPIIQSAMGICQFTTGHWSITRPGVIFIGLQNGNIEIWDLLLRTHEPIQVQNVSSFIITKIVPKILKNNSHTLAISDGNGILHILELPWSLWSPITNEQNLLEEYFDRELIRLECKYKCQLEKEEALKKEKETKLTEATLEEQKPKQPESKPKEIDKETLVMNEYKEFERLEITTLVDLEVLPPSALEQLIELEVEEEEAVDDSI